MPAIRANYADVPSRDVDHMWSRIAIRGPDECWPWTGGTDRKGYGRFAISGRRWLYAHRLIHLLETGETPECACHSCDNPLCCNPRHLFSGSINDNAQDMIRKGRKTSGEALSFTKLTDAQVLEIFAMKDTGSVIQIAARFAVSTTLVRLIWKGKRRQSLTASAVPA